MSKDQKPNYSAWDVKPLSQNKVAKFDLLADNLITYASLAPNTHNTQPWNCVVEEGRRRIDIFADPRFILPASDQHSRQAFISIGCFLGAFQTATDFYRFEAEEVLFPDHDNPNHIATYIIPENQNSKSGPLGELIHYIPQRVTNRSEYTGEPLAQSVYESLKSINGRAGLTFKIITDRATKGIIAGLQETADNVVLTNSTFGLELADWIIPNDSDMGRGMPGAGFGLDDVGTRSIIDDLRLGKSVNDHAADFAIADRIGINSASAVTVTLAPQDSRNHWINAGKAYMESCLMLTREGLASAMTAAQVEVPVASIMLRTRLMSPLKHVVVVNRIGRPTKDRPHSPRVSAEQITDWK